MCENLDLVRSICANWERGDFSSLDWADPEIAYTVVGGTAPGSWVGVAGMADVTRDLLSAWEDFHIEVDEYREHSSQRVLVLLNFRRRAKTSGVDGVDVPGATGAYLFRIRRGRVTDLTYYLYRDCALADLGLKE